jgi:hypothetical protein
MTWRPGTALAVLLLAAAGCGHYQEIGRFPSPDGRFEAVVVEVETGAGNPFLYHLYVVAHGAAWRKGSERVRYSDPVRFRVAWAAARRLELCHDDARIHSGPEPPVSTPDQASPDGVEIALVRPASSCSKPGRARESSPARTRELDRRAVLRPRRGLLERRGGP